MGAIISVQTDRVITIEGVDRLGGFDHLAIPDRIEAGSWACAALATNGDIYVRGAQQLPMMPFLNVFRRIGGAFDVDDEGIRFWHPGGTLRAIALETDVHPGFMTDWQQPLVVALTQTTGLSIVHETVYENRLGFTDALLDSGAQIQTYRECLGGSPCRFGRANFQHSAVISGPDAVAGGRDHRARPARRLQLPHRRAGRARGARRCTASTSSTAATSGSRRSSTPSAPPTSSADAPTSPDLDSVRTRRSGPAKVAPGAKSGQGQRMSSPGPMPTTHTRVATRPASSSSTLTRWPTRRCRSPLATAAPGRHAHLEAVVEQGRAGAVGLDAVDGGLHARKASVREGRAAVRAEPEAHRGGQRGRVVDVDAQARQVEVEPHVAEPLVRGGAARPEGRAHRAALAAGRVSSAVPLVVGVGHARMPGARPPLPARARTSCGAQRRVVAEHDGDPARPEPRGRHPPRRRRRASRPGPGVGDHARDRRRATHRGHVGVGGDDEHAGTRHPGGERGHGVAGEGVGERRRGPRGAGARRLLASGPPLTGTTTAQSCPGACTPRSCQHDAPCSTSPGARTTMRLTRPHGRQRVTTPSDHSRPFAYRLAIRIARPLYMLFTKREWSGAREPADAGWLRRLPQPLLLRRAAGLRALPRRQRALAALPRQGRGVPGAGRRGHRAARRPDPGLPRDGPGGRRLPGGGRRPCGPARASRSTPRAR